LREGLDLPEVSLVAILDADKEGFLRSHRSLTQTAGRAARNLNGKVIMYADKITESMQKTIDDTNRRRAKQEKYNTDHGLVPQALNKSIEGALPKSRGRSESDAYIEREELNLAADPVIQYMNAAQIEKAISTARKSMEKSAKELDFISAAKYRDELYALETVLKDKK
jgi:excinuclease ABC subunit B